MKKRVFIAEDETNILETIVLNLELEGYEVGFEKNGRLALHKLKNETFDLIILDVMMPELDGFTICENIRTLGINTPVLFLTAKNDTSDRVKGLKLGANDYLGKPFNLEELLLRVKILSQAKLGIEFNIPNRYVFGNNVINFETYEIIGPSGITEIISKREAELLKLLISEKGKVVSRELILDTFWKEDSIPTPRTIDNYILSFRKYFEENPKQPKHFHSIRSVGYKFTP